MNNRGSTARCQKWNPSFGIRAFVNSIGTKVAALFDIFAHEEGKEL